MQLDTEKSPYTVHESSTGHAALASIALSSRSDSTAVRRVAGGPITTLKAAAAAGGHSPKRETPIARTLSRHPSLTGHTHTQPAGRPSCSQLSLSLPLSRHLNRVVSITAACVCAAGDVHAGKARATLTINKISASDFPEFPHPHLEDDVRRFLYAFLYLPQVLCVEIAESREPRAAERARRTPFNGMHATIFTKTTSPLKWVLSEL